MTQTRNVFVESSVELRRRVVESHPDKVQIIDLSDGGLRMTFKTKPNEMLKIAGASAATAVFAVGAGFLLRWAYTDTDFDLRIFGYVPWIMWLLGIMCLGWSGMMLLIRLVTGPDRDRIVEARPGRLKLDRYLAGDHIVREYSPEDIRCIFVESHGIGEASLNMETRQDSFTLLAGIPPDLQIAAVELIAPLLWQPTVLVVYNFKFTGGRSALIVASADPIMER